MSRPIVIAHHLIFTGYGWWLPNDPRGSTSRTIRNDIIADLGELHHGRKKLQPASRDIREFYERAGRRLEHELLEFSRLDIERIADSFAAVIHHVRYTCYACAIMPDHVHALIRKHKHLVEEMTANLQDASRLRLRDCGARPPDHPVWGEPGRKVFLDHPDEIRRTVRYIEGNPGKLGLPRQKWGFVKDCDGWPLHPGHSPNSPYVRRLRGRG